MKTLHKTLLIAFMFVLLGALVVPAAASVSRTYSISEADINSSYRVTNPARRAVSDVSVDLQPGQVVISSTHTYPNNRVYSVTTTLIPSVSNGRIVWDVSSVSVSGSAIPADALQQINEWMDASWRNFLKNKYTGRVTSVSVTDDTFSITFTSRR